MKWNNVIILILPACFSMTLSAQNTDKKSDKPISISGKILTSDQKPVIGAVFYTDNLKTNFKSGSNGAYKIKVSASTYKLSVRSAEYGSYDTVLNGQTTINFILPGLSKPQNEKQAETGNRKNENDVPGVSSQVNQSSRFNKLEGERINNSQYQNIYEMLTGTVPGVQIEGKKITIRGPSSFYGTTTPLFVVDGVIVSSIDDINPIEVKSIQVLKSSSAAIYGSRGSNGVIIITRIKAPDMLK